MKPCNGSSPALAGPSRRQFVKTFVFGSAGTVVGPAWVGTLLATLLGENRAAAASDGVISLSLSKFPALLNVLGSVRVSVNPILPPYPNGSFFPIIVSHGLGGVFYAVSSECTHRSCITNAYDGSVIACPCHGSEFAIDGTLTRGPANQDLTSYDVDYDGADTLKITVPGLGYSINSYKIVTGTSPRVRLDFPTFDVVDYEVRFRRTFTDAWTVVPFATTPTGALTNTVLTGNGANATVYVQQTAPAGFFCIAIQVKEV